MHGETFSHYRLLEKVGEGGVGVVYKAEDTRLGRTVAIKMLSERFSADRLSVERFQREASSASALNNPHICTIHDIGEHMGRWYLVMEHLEGRDLRSRIAAGALGLRELLDIALQAIDALAAAHQGGIVHRDIKPANIFLTQSGTVKLLDFGLAKRAAKAPPAARDHEAETLTMPGIAVGTAHYMSPEQACGMETDVRSDLFSFGCVLYEMATGTQPFRGESLPAVLSAIVHLPARPPQEANPDIPAELARIIEKALEKEPDLRYQSPAEMRADLLRLQRQAGASVSGARSGSAQVRTPSADAPAAAQGAPRIRLRTWLWTALAGAACAAAGWLGAKAAASRVVVPALEYRQITDEPGMEQFPSLDATGEWLVYAARPRGNWDVYLRRVDGRNVRNLTEAGEADDTQPAFSPDGRQIVFRSSRGGGGLFVMGATGEAPDLISAAGYNPCWSPDGRQIVFATEGVESSEDRYLSASQLWIVDLNTHETKLLYAGDAVQPAWSPGGRRIAFWHSRGGSRDIATIRSDGGQPVAVTSDRYVDWNPVWSRDGRYLYFLSDRLGSMNLWRVAIDQETGAVKGALEALSVPSPHVGHISFSRDGRRFVFTNNAFRSTVNRAPLNLPPATAKVSPVEISLAFTQAVRPHLSADGGWVAFTSRGLVEDIHVARIDGSELKHITSDGRRNRGPRWAPDGRRLAFFSGRSGNNEIWVSDAGGTGLRQVTFTKKNAVWPVWSPDGKRLAYTLFGEGSFIIEADAAWTAQTPVALPGPGPGVSFSAWNWSRDGQSIAGFLQDRATGKFPGIAVYSVESKTYRSVTQFGMDPVWLGDGRRLLFTHQGRIHLANLDSGSVQEVLQVAPREISPRGFSVSPDGRWIYFAMSGNESDIWLASAK